MFCSNCGTQIDDRAVVCAKCGCAVGKTAIASADDDAALRLIVPIGRSGWSIAAGYLGLLSLIFPLGVFAFVFGIIAIRDLRKHPDKHGAGRAWFGIVAGGFSVLIYGICIVVAVFGC